MDLVGYERARTEWQLAILPGRTRAEIRPVTKLQKINSVIAVPAGMAPPADDLLQHLLFGLKHEGTRLDVLAVALPLVTADDLVSALRETPNGRYLRKAACLWEHFTGETLSLDGIRIQGSVEPLFDPRRYVVGPGERNARWRVQINALGTLDYCATVERTPAIEAGLAGDVLGRANRFLKTLPPTLLDRAVSWAYLHETRESFAIERDSPSPSKAERFVQLLQQAPERRYLEEDYLVELQNVTIDNPYNQSASFRGQQNHLQGPGRGAHGVTYVPPPPDLCRDLMGQLLAFANDAANHVDPIVAASVISFGFVFIHPFMDGNGRLSRFLIHHALSRENALEKGYLLPISIAMRKDEAGYLKALSDYSRPMRSLWSINWIDGEEYALEFKGSEAAYRYWDATGCTEFLFAMAEQALVQELRQETEFLRHYDKLYKALNERYDVRGNTLSTLIVQCLDNGGAVSANRRRQHQYDVPAALFDDLQNMATRLVGDANKQNAPGGSDVAPSIRPMR